VSTLISA